MGHSDVDKRNTISNKLLKRTTARRRAVTDWAYFKRVSTPSCKGTRVRAFAKNELVLPYKQQYLKTQMSTLAVLFVNYDVIYIYLYKESVARVSHLEN